MPELQLITTNDGSHSLYNKTLDTTYHSRFGALTESRLIFIDSGFNYYLNSSQFDKSSIKVLEIGLGTGLNAVLTYLESVKNSIIVSYDAVEAYPIPLTDISLFNFSDILEFDSELFKQIHHSEWENPVAIHPYFTLAKYKEMIENWNSDSKYDIIYYDAFGPETQPELWNIEIMKKMFDLLVSDGVLVTFCAKGSFKRCLRDVGFKVESLPGPPGKREITRAIK